MVVVVVEEEEEVSVHGIPPVSSAHFQLSSVV